MTCIRAGEAFATLTAQAGSQRPTEFTMKVEDGGDARAEFGVYDIVATELLPAPLSTVSIDPKSYVLTVTVFARL